MVYKAINLVGIFFIVQISISAQILFNGNKNYYNYEHEIYNLIERGVIDSKSMKKANRLKRIYQDRLHPSGQLSVYQNKLSQSILTFELNGGIDSIEWTQIGNGQIIQPRTGNVYGNGRVSFIEFHPTNYNTIYIGSPGGCVWVSHDNGDNWEVLSSVPSCRGFSDMHFDTITGDIYLLTGDFDGRNSPFHGIYKSSDEGSTWEVINIPEISFAKKILTHPIIENKLFLLADNQLYRSFDTGLNWHLVEGLNNVYDYEFLPSSDSIIYAFANDSLFKSMDLGLNFSTINTQFDTFNNNRAELEIVKFGNENKLYIATANGPNIAGIGNTEGLFESNDHGVSFEQIEETDQFSAGQSRYNFLFAVHPTIENKFFVGWVELYWNDPNTMEWTKDYDLINEFDFHADFHCHAFDPKEPNCILIGNDGGVYRTCDLGETWEDISGDLQLAQIYHFNNSNTCDDLAVAGLQDNGSATYHSETWKKLGSGDGLSCGFTALSNDTVFYSTQNSSLSRLDSLLNVLDSETFDYFISNVSPVELGFSNGFRNIFEPSPIKSGLCFYKKFNTLHKSENSGESWDTSLETDFTIYDVYLSSVKSDYLVVSNLEIESGNQNIQIQYSTDEGNNWISKNVNHPSLDTLEQKPIPNCIAMSNQDSFKIWLGLNHDHSHKVLMSSDFGESWTDYSEGLPTIQINDIIHQPYTNDALYLANDLGVYFRNDTMSQWRCITSTIPPTIFSELRISNVAQKLRASTFGYGLWETDLFNIEMTPPFANLNCDVIELCPNDQYVVESSSSYEISNLEWYIENGTLVNPNSDSVIVSFSEPGIYDVTIVASNAYGIDTFTVLDKFLVRDNSISIDSMRLSNDQYILSISEEYSNTLWSTNESTNDILATNSGWYYVNSYNQYGCAVSDSIYIDLVTNINEVETQKCSIYPNPTDRLININCEFSDAEILVLDYTGNKVLSEDYSSDLSIDLTSGVYILLVKNKFGEIMETHKLTVLK